MDYTFSVEQLRKCSKTRIFCRTANRKHVVDMSRVPKVVFFRSVTNERDMFNERLVSSGISKYHKHEAAMSSCGFNCLTSFPPTINRLSDRLLRLRRLELLSLLLRVRRPEERSWDLPRGSLKLVNPLSAATELVFLSDRSYDNSSDPNVFMSITK